MTDGWTAALCRTVHAAWGTWCAPRARLFRLALRDPEAAQARILERLLRRNRDSEYGRVHGFRSIGGVGDYRRRVPVVGYDDLEPWIHRIRRGERDVLATDRVRRLVPSGGSTSGCKLLPWNRAVAGEWSRAVQPWVHDLLARHPEVGGGPAYWSVSPAVGDPVETPSAVPVGFDEDSAYLGGLLGPLVRAVLAVPEEMRHVGEMQTFRYLTALALLRAPGLRLISVWHPSFFELLLDAMERHWPALLEDVARGTATPPRASGTSVRRGDGLPDPATRRGTAPDGRRGRSAAAAAARVPGSGRPDPHRAATLRRAGPTDLRAAWPRLALLSCWADGPSAGPARALGARFPGVRLQPKGLLATEGVVSIPFGGARPAAVRSHFLEFLDAGGEAHTVADLREGDTYDVVMSTGAGLYRYRLGDRVRVEGFLERTPCLRFLGREDRVSDRRGEKLRDSFVAGVLEDLFDGGPPPFALLAPDPRDGTLRYTLYVEPLDRGLPRDLAERLDAALSANPHYRYCRRLGQLGPAAIFRVAGGAHATYLAREGGPGRRTGDVKPQALSPLDDWARHLTGAYDA